MDSFDELPLATQYVISERTLFGQSIAMELPTKRTEWNYIGLQSGPKSGPQTHDHNCVKSSPILIFFPLEAFLVNLLKIPPHLAYIATLPRETLMSAKQAINDKLQGSVATYWRCCGVVNNQIRKSLLLIQWFFFKSVNIWPSYKQERDYVVHFHRLLAVCCPGVQSVWDD